MMLPMSMLLPGLAPDLAWCLGLSVPEECGCDGSRTPPMSPGGRRPDQCAPIRNMIRDETPALGKREELA